MGRGAALLLSAVELLACAALMRCADEPIYSSCGRVYCTYPNFIARSPLYSAYDGVHEYSVVAHIPSAAPGSLDSDPVLAATVKWQLDQAFVSEGEFPDIPAATKLTTKRAGTTQIKFTAMTLSGYSFSHQAKLTISQAHADEWSLGDERFRAGLLGGWFYDPVAPGEGTCGLPVNFTFPSVYPCLGCHDDLNNTSTNGSTVIHHEGYSDSDLINIVAVGAKPAGGTFESPTLRDLPMPDCVFSEIHAWDLSEAEKRGVLWKVRSIPPSVEP